MGAQVYGLTSKMEKADFRKYVISFRDIGKGQSDEATSGMFGNEALCLWHSDEGADLI